MTDPPTSSVTTRRTFLQHGGLAAGSLLLGRQASATETETGSNRATSRMVVPEVDAFEGNYEGQFVFVQEPTEPVPSDLPLDGCDRIETWPDDQTRAYQAALLDRISEEPAAADVEVYTDGRESALERDSHYIVQNAVACPEGYVGLEAEWLRGASVALKEPGPTVESTSSPGFGVLGAAAGGLGALAYRALRSSGGGGEPDGDQ